MKLWKRMSALVLAGAMLFSLAACGGGEKVVIEGTTIKLFANFNPADVSAADQEMFDRATAATGVSVEWEIPPSSSYMEKLQLMLASGSYPDAVLFPSTTDQAYRNALDAGVIIPVNDYLKYGPNFMKYTYDITWEALKSKGDDDIYALPRTSLARNEGMAARKDWFESVGLEAPADYTVNKDEFMEIAKRFTLNDPNKSGKNDTFGVGQAPTPTKRVEVFDITRGFFGNYGWQRYEGAGAGEEIIDPTFSKTLSIYKNQLQYSQDLFVKGYADPDTPMLQTSDVSGKMSNGTIGISNGFSGHTLGTQRSLQKINPEGTMTYMYGKDDKGEVKGNNFSTGVYGQWGIMSSCKNPAAVVAFLDYFLGDEGWKVIVEGIEGSHYEWVEGKRTGIEGVTSWRGSMVRRKGDFNYFTGALNEDPGPDKDMLEAIFKISQDTLHFALDNGFTPAAMATTQYINYQKKMDEGVTKIVTGASPVSSYDALLDGWYQNGGTDYVKEMLAYIAKSEQN